MPAAPEPIRSFWVCQRLTDDLLADLLVDAELNRSWWADFAAGVVAELARHRARPVGPWEWQVEREHLVTTADDIDPASLEPDDPPLPWEYHGWLIVGTCPAVAA